MIIDECPSVDTEYNINFIIAKPDIGNIKSRPYFSLFSNSLMYKHMDSLTELVKRDKNHPSVIMWSIANEPRTHLLTSDIYFK